jgi:FMN phosphatase YigB (HAD superfamily)
MKGTEAMRANSSNQTNEHVFWKVFDEILPNHTHLFKQHIHRFYDEHYPSVKAASRLDNRAKILIEKLQKKHLRLFLATNPLFPSVATHQRVQWAGLDLAMFEKITTMENSLASKPNPRYFQLLLDEFSLKSNETLMLGNDWIEDTAAEKVGIKTIIITDYAMKEKPSDALAQGMTFDDLLSTIDSFFE